MKTRKLATEIVKTLTDAGFTAYFAGGWVRDYLLGHPSADIDIATNATTDQIAEIFPRTIPVGESFGVMIVVKENQPFEVATFRKDIEYLDGRKPSKVDLSSTPQEDAQRRDFTINGMFYDPLKEEVIDFVEGRADLDRGLIKAIGNADERFVEDRLRMIRAIRIASRFNFKIDPDTEIAIQKNAHTLFPAVALERVWNEFKKMSEENFDKALLDLHKFGLLQVIFPRLKEMSFKGIESLVASFHKFPEDCPTILYLMELFPNETPETRQQVCEYLKISSKEMQLVEFFDKAKMQIDSPNTNNLVELTHFYADSRSLLVLKVLATHKDALFLKKHLQEQEKLKKHIDRIINKKPLVGSKHLLDEGIMPGRHMGQILKEAETLAITQDFHSPEEVIAQLKKTSIWSK
jgi:poly(A) polymerase